MDCSVKRPRPRGVQVQRRPVLLGQEQPETEHAADRGLIHDRAGEQRPPVLRAQVRDRLDTVGGGRFQAGPLAVIVLQLIPLVGQLTAARGGPRRPVTVDHRHGGVFRARDAADRELDQPLQGDRLVDAVGQGRRQLPELVGQHGQRITGAEIVRGGGH